MSETYNCQNVAEIAYKQIKNMIIRGEVAQGEVLSILHFADLLNIGRMPTTTACQKLEAEGFITILPKKGVLIKPMSINEIRDTYETREAIELYMGERAFANITKEDIEILESSIEKQRGFESSHDPFGFMEEDLYFHRCILQRYPNQTLIEIHNQLADRIFLVGVQNTKNPERMHQSIDDHLKIIDCIKRGDKEEFLKAVSANQMRGYIFMISTNR